MVCRDMAESILERLHLRTRYVRDLAASAAEEPAPMSMLDIKESVRSCLHLRDYLHAATGLFYAEAFGDKIQDYDQAGHLGMACFDAVRRAYEAVRQRLEATRTADWSDEERKEVERLASELKDMVNDLDTLQQDFHGRWPWARPDLLARSRTEEAVAKRRPAKVAFDEVRNRNRRMGD